MAVRIISGALLLLFVALLAQRVWRATGPSPGGHDVDQHGRGIVALASDRYHVDVVFTADRQLKLYTLARDASRVHEVEAQELSAQLSYENGRPVESIELRPAPQRGDRTGFTSCFVGVLPADDGQQISQVRIPNLCIGSERFHVVLVRDDAGHADAMPLPAGEKEEQRIHLTPGGKYTLADIEANGRTIPAWKYRGFRAEHHITTQPGDVLCPITHTRANPACTWVVDGTVYAFCCPPCISEFVQIAKESPEKLPQPDELNQRQANATAARKRIAD